MTPERWDQISQIAADALDIPLSPNETARRAFVAQACAGDPELLAEVQGLLEAEDPGNFLEPDPPPERIGVYRVVHELGRGGMGAVYLGERADGQFEQQVAIKIVKRGMDSRAVVNRFVAERQILARLQHPNIARLFDGGITPDGRPYFVMEYLEGAEPITSYCRRLELSVDLRIALFLSVCDAVEYAHRHLVLHRDLKPGNILVDAGGSLKLLDFGIAKLLEEDGEAQPTELGSRAMTLQYASPEQMRGEALTTASDVYALGLLLYELLAGRPPYRVPHHGPAEQVRVICETQPKRPSEVAAAPFARKLRGDLDNVVLKALEKDAARRYPSAASLAEDLRRFQANQTVMARPASVVYRARKYASRNWKALAVAAVFGTALIAAVTSALIQGRRAESNFQDVRRLANSFLFEFHDSIAKLPGSTPARELVERRAAEYLDILSRQASHDTAVKRELAESYIRLGSVQGNSLDANLGKTKEATASMEKAVALLTEVYRARPKDPEVRAELARAKLGLCRVVAETDPARADQLRAQALDLSQQALSPKLLESAKLTLARAYFGQAERQADAGRTSEALAARNRSIQLLTEMVASKPANEDAQRLLGQSLKRRAVLYLSKLHEMDKARQDLDAAMHIDDQRIARDPSNAVARLDQALGQSYLSKLLLRQGDLASSDDMIHRAIATRVELLHDDPANIRNRTWLMGNYADLAALRRVQRRLSESMTAIGQGWAVANQVDGATKKNPEWISFGGKLHFEAAQTRAQMGACPDAQRELEEGVRSGEDATTAKAALAAHCGGTASDQKSKIKNQN
jgi:non-specific serine/threonine protein kinase/serine/threonine-protein kinase